MLDWVVGIGLGWFIGRIVGQRLNKKAITGLENAAKSNYVHPAYRYYGGY